MAGDAARAYITNKYSRDMAAQMGFDPDDPAAAEFFQSHGLFMGEQPSTGIVGQAKAFGTGLLRETYVISGTGPRECALEESHVKHPMRASESLNEHLMETQCFFGRGIENSHHPAASLLREHLEKCRVLLHDLRGC